MSGNVRLGMLTPSSNTALEPITSAMLSGVPGASAHFSRFMVTEITISGASDGQFDEDKILRAAELLTHAKVQVIAWNGTSASWLGYERDERLCERIKAATGVDACTSVLSFLEIFERAGVSRLGLVTPYVEPVQARIIMNFKRAGIECPAERHSGLQDNFSFAEVAESEVAEMIRAVARQGCDAVAVVCTNMRGARVAASLEAELGLPVYDSIAVTVWKSLLLAGVEPGRVRGWGGLFSDPLLGLGPERVARRLEVSG